MKFEYVCPKCNNRFASVANAIREHVECPFCQQVMNASNIDTVIDDSAAHGGYQQNRGYQTPQRPVQARPVQARPVQARPVQAHKVQPEPTAPPIQEPRLESVTHENVAEQRVEVDSVQPDPVLSDPIDQEPVQNEVQPVSVDEAPDSEPENNSVQMSFSQALSEVGDEELEVDENLEIAEELKGSMTDTGECVPPAKRSFKPILYIVFVVVALLGIAAFFLGKKDKNTERAELVLKNEKASILALKKFAQDNPNMKITQYFMFDLDQDGQKEVIANNDKNLVVFGAKNGVGELLYNQPVFEWVYLRGKGLFVVTVNDQQTEGGAVWLVKKKNTLDEDASQENYQFANGVYRKFLHGKESKVPEDDYYGFVNTIIKNYTKLTPVNL